MEPLFEVELRRLGLVPSYEATQSAALRRWVDAHWKHNYVPEELLVIWGYNQSLMPEPGCADLKRMRKAAPEDSAVWRRRSKKKPPQSVKPAHNNLIVIGS